MTQLINMTGKSTPVYKYFNDAQLMYIIASSGLEYYYQQTVSMKSSIDKLQMEVATCFDQILSSHTMITGHPGPSAMKDTQTTNWPVWLVTRMPLRKLHASFFTITV